MHTIEYINNFQLKLYGLLKDYSNNKLNLLLSGGSILPLFDMPLYQTLNTKEWHVYFSDERLSGCLNIDDARKYMKNLEVTFHDLRNEDLGKIEIAMLSVGEDGHIASLFPNHDALHMKGEKIIIHDSPKEPLERITVSIEVLNLCKRLYFVIPPKDGKVKDIMGPHPSISKKILIDYSILLDSSLKKLGK